MNGTAPGNVRRNLAIKWSVLGDMVMMASAVREGLARAFPEAAIGLNIQTNCVNLFAHDPRFAEAWAIDVRSRQHRWANSLAWLQQARAARYDLAIDLQRSDHTRLPLTRLWRRGGAPRVRIGNRGSVPNTHPPAIRESGTLPLLTMKSVLQLLGIPTVTPHPVLRPAPDRLAALRRQHGLDDGRYVVLLPGSAAVHALKRWGAGRFAELARLMHARGVPKIVVIGGPDEVGECTEIAAVGDYAVNLNGQLQLLDIAPLCAGALAIVGNDTGTAHFASTADRPLWVLCGPTDPHRVKPIGSRRIVVQARLPYSNCYSRTSRNPDSHARMKAITPEWVASRVPELASDKIKTGQDWPGGRRSF